ncbi:outer membrane beta-barrel protein [Fluviicola taffensis]|uniref:outer membrane beta-barrel protein n=1 Tax=Fluviicola taffensis TaxID=191579 RepID=UPI0011D2336C|nr:outer membrane beta-barrel protein [Fluviicola taffensis]
MKKIVLLIFFFISYLGYSQNMTIKANVVDTNTQTVVRNAVGIVKRVRDSVLLDFKRSDKYGHMEFTLPIDTVEFTIIHPEYGIFRAFFFGSKETNEFIMDTLAMPDKSTALDEVLIYANRNPIYYRGDTLVYVADSFKVKENAVVEDLIRKLPGMTIDENGKIKNQGKEIGQVLVDGDEFFGNDPTIATKNLAAKGVQTVEVYEKDAEDGSDEKVQVLDLRLKDEAKKGYFGKVNLAGGLDKFTPVNRGFYEGEFLLNSYNKNRKMAVYALGSNTPKTNLNGSDMYKFGLSEGRDWMAENDDLESFSGGGQGENEGIPNTFKGGFYLDQKFNKGARVRLNYAFSQFGVKTQTNSRSQYLLTDTSYTTDLNSYTKESYLQHQVGIKYSQRIDSLTRFEIEPKFQWNKTNQNSLSRTEFLSQRDTLTRYTTIDNGTEAIGSNLNTTFRLYKDFKNKNRKLIARYNFVGINNRSDGTLLSQDINANTDTVNYSFDQLKQNRSNSMAHTAYADYFEPLGKRFKLEFDYEFYGNNNSQRKTTLNPISGEYVDVDTLYSNQFKTDRQQHRAGAFLIYENPKLRVSVGSRFRTIDIDNRNIFTDSIINQNLNNVLPRIVFRYKFSQTTRVMIQYNTNSSLPSIDQLQPVLNNANPNFVQIGNSGLRPNYSHTVTGSFNTWKGLSGFYMYSGFSYSHIKDNFSSNTVFNQFGGSISQAINVKNSDFLYYWAGAGIPIKPIKDLSLQINANGNFTSTQNQINFINNDTRNTGIGTDLSLNYNGDSLRFEVGGGFDYNVPFNSLTTQSNQPYTTYNITAEIDWTLPFRLFIKTDATYNINTGRTSGYNVNYVIWNASLQRAFTKTGNLLFGIEAYDILNQNISNFRTVNNNVIVDQRTNIIRRYFMAKLTYRFNNFKTKEEDGNGWY